VSTYGTGGNQLTETSSINMLSECPIIEDGVLFKAFMVGDCSVLSFQYFMKDKSSLLQCDGFVSCDNFHMFAGVVYMIEVSTVTFMGRHWDKATLNFRNRITSMNFLHRKVTSRAMLELTWEAIKDVWSTIATKEKEEKWDLVLVRKGCVQLFKNRLVAQKFC
jgi:hypothetical protein